MLQGFTIVKVVRKAGGHALHRVSEHANHVAPLRLLRQQRVVAAGEARECARALCLDVLDMAAGTEIVHQVQQANFAFVAAAIFE